MYINLFKNRKVNDQLYTLEIPNSSHLFYIYIYIYIYIFSLQYSIWMWFSWSDRKLSIEVSFGLRNIRHIETNIANALSILVTWKLAGLHQEDITHLLVKLFKVRSISFLSESFGNSIWKSFVQIFYRSNRLIQIDADQGSTSTMQIWDIFIHVNIDFIRLITSVCCPRIMRRKSNCIIVCKDLFNPSCIVSIDVPLYRFLVVIMSCSLSNPTTVFHCEIYFLKTSCNESFYPWKLYIQLFLVVCTFYNV